MSERDFIVHIIKEWTAIDDLSIKVVWELQLYN